MEIDDDITSDEQEELKRARGQRAEEVAQWYFRLNGFLMIPGFIVHPDVKSDTPRTEADLLGIRLKNSAEVYWHKSSKQTFRQSELRQPSPMRDDPRILEAGKVDSNVKHLVAMVEVKAGECDINGPWSNRAGLEKKDSSSNMERALGRIGFCANRAELQEAATNMYNELRHASGDYVVQYFAVGKRPSPLLQETYPKLVQITFENIAVFLQERFSRFPQKIPLNTDLALWKGFGDEYRWWFESCGDNDRGPSTAESIKAVSRYIETGRCR